MILPLSCHGTFPRALALIEWKLNLLTFFSACYSLALLFINSTQIQISSILKKTRGCFHGHQCWDFYHPLNAKRCIQSRCSVYCGKGLAHCQYFVILFILSLPPCLEFKWLQQTGLETLFALYEAYDWQHCVVIVCRFIFDLENNTVGNITNGIYIQKPFND